MQNQKKKNPNSLQWSKCQMSPLMALIPGGCRGIHHRITDISDGVIQENPHKKAEQLVGLAPPAPAVLPAGLLPPRLRGCRDPGAAGLGAHSTSVRAQDWAGSQLVHSQGLVALDKPEEQQEVAQGRRWLWLFSFKKGLVLGQPGKPPFRHFGRRNWLCSDTGCAGKANSSGWLRLAP